MEATLEEKMNELSIKNNENEYKSKSKQLTYKVEEKVDSGTFGDVFKGKIVETNQLIAIKRVFQDRRYKNRELKIMQNLNHPNVIKLEHAYYTYGKNEDDVYLNIVMDFIPENLYKLAKSYRHKSQKISNTLIKLYSYQMLRGMAYLHALGISHRDIKPQNMLVNSVDNILKICDFGSAKILVKGETSIAYICSRYYRAPELILGCTNYSTKIDIWSIGCVIAELITGVPLFMGDNSVDQLVEIIKALGKPTNETIKKMNPNYDDFKFPDIKPTPFKKIFGDKADPLLLDLIGKILVYNPSERLSAMEALLHPYFDELRTEKFFKENIGKMQIPELFDFTKGF